MFDFRKNHYIKGFVITLFIQYLSNRGIDFASSNERYLNFSAIHSLPDATVELLRNIAQRVGICGLGSEEQFQFGNESTAYQQASVGKRKGLYVEKTLKERTCTS